MQRTRLWMALAMTMAASFAVAAPLALAQEDESTDDSAVDAAELDTISVVGSRRFERTDTETMVPVDIIPMADAASKGGQFDLAQALQFTAPSFNSTRQTGADGADLIDSAALRGLGSDQTLVLLNGKRFHNVALVNLFGARNRGNTGTDLNSIPLLAIERVEVLRDGAAAQYGSDAIAGVMNIALKRSAGCETVSGYSQYTAGDGHSRNFANYCGWEFESGGFLSVTGEWGARGRSDRSDADNPRIIGDTAVQNGTVYVNGELPVAAAANLYFTLGAQNRDASSAAFARGGVGTDDVPSRNSAALYPDGFVPFINGDLADRHGTLGIWGLVDEWRIDLSTTYGYNDLYYNIDNTLNASIANRDLLNGGVGISPTRFDAGGFEFRQATTNFDVSRFTDAVFNGLNIAFGAEYRAEEYAIQAGEVGSYIDADGPGGGNAGSQGFPGFQPGDETNSDRNSYALYVDLEADLTEQFTSSVALRYEDYSDFGSTLDGKLAAAFRLTDSTVLRGSFSTGFRAPSLQQRFFSSTFTDFISGEPVDVLLAPNGGTVARAAGIPDLTEEESTGFTLGFTLKPMDNLSIAVDAYRIDIDDRIVLSGRFNTDDPDIGSILESLGVGEAQFFVNSIDTETQGIDLTATYQSELASGTLNTILAYNWSKTEVQAINTPPSLVGREGDLLSERERLFIENGGPRSKAVLAFDYTQGPWNGVVKFIYFGSQTLGTFSGPPEPNARYDAKSSADVALTYAFNEDRTQFTLGGSNVFDTFPSRQNADETDNGFIYDSVQFGLNGASVFARLAHKW
jgi:iron complex outermembrane receptor protein